MSVKPKHAHRHSSHPLPVFVDGAVDRSRAPFFNLGKAVCGCMLVFPLEYRQSPHARQLSEARHRAERADGPAGADETSGHGSMRRQRRGLAMLSSNWSGSTLPLSGDVVTLGYYYVTLHIGTPPRPFSVIVDTGSSVTAIPCTGCRRCSKHMNTRFDPATSRTFQAVPCSQGLSCTSCRRGACGYHASYEEGSSHLGYLAQDFFYFEPPALPSGDRRQGPARHLDMRAPRCASVRITFACSNKESGLFLTQAADGIMGLGGAPPRRVGSRMPRRRGPFLPAGAGRRGMRNLSSVNVSAFPPTLLDELVAHGMAADLFSLRICTTGGSTLSLGERPSAAAGPRIQWTSVQPGPLYHLRINSVRLGGLPLAHGQPPKSSLLDSGTTFIYMHSAAFAPLLGEMRARRCAALHSVPASSAELCVQLPLGSSLSLLDGCYDNVTFVLPGAILAMTPSQVRMPRFQHPSTRISPLCCARAAPPFAGRLPFPLHPCPTPPDLVPTAVLSPSTPHLSLFRRSQYFYAADAAAGHYCMGIFDNHAATLVLGATAIRGREVIFDREGARVGFRDAECIHSPPPAPGRRPAYIRGGRGSWSHGLGGVRQSRSRVDRPLCMMPQPGPLHAFTATTWRWRRAAGSRPQITHPRMLMAACLCFGVALSIGVLECTPCVGRMSVRRRARGWGGARGHMRRISALSSPTSRREIVKRLSRIDETEEAGEELSRGSRASRIDEGEAAASHKEGTEHTVLIA